MKKKRQKANKSPQLANDYPKWVCFKCGYEYSTKKCFEVSTYHIGQCGVCHKDSPVTQPRDFSYPSFSRSLT